MIKLLVHQLGPRGMTSMSMMGVLVFETERDNISYMKRHIMHTSEL